LTETVDSSSVGVIGEEARQARLERWQAQVRIDKAEEIRRIEAQRQAEWLRQAHESAEERRRKNRLAWAAYYWESARRIRQVAEELATQSEQKALKLEEV
jgi:hypothetical protein